MPYDSQPYLQDKLDDPRTRGRLRIDRRYYISSPLVIRSPKTVEWGPEGQLVANADFTGIGMIAVKADEVRLIAPRLNGNKTETEVAGCDGFCGIYVQEGARGTITDGYIFNMPTNLPVGDGEKAYSTGDGIYLGGAKQSAYWTIRGVTIQDCGRNGVSVTNAKYVSISECHIRKPGLAGVYIESARETQAMVAIRVVNNSIRECNGDKGCGVKISGALTKEKGPMIVLGNSFQGNKEDTSYYKCVVHSWP